MVIHNDVNPPDVVESWVWCRTHSAEVVRCVAVWRSACPARESDSMVGQVKTGATYMGRVGGGQAVVR